MNCLHFKNLNLEKIFSRLKADKQNEKKCGNCKRKNENEIFICLNVN